jgi:hypothetical protein
MKRLKGKIEITEDREEKAKWGKAARNRESSGAFKKVQKVKLCLFLCISIISFSITYAKGNIWCP